MENSNYASMPPTPPTAPLDFMGAVKRVFNNYANFNGRASRPEFWWWMLFTFAVSCVLNILGLLTDFFTYINGIFCLATIIPTLAVSWRRLHDVGRAGGWWFINLIPLVGCIIFILWVVKPSEPQANRFGEVPAN